MIVGAMETVMQLSPKLSLFSNLLLFILFSIVCLFVKRTKPVMVLAMILSSIYALLMMAVLIGVLIDLIDKGAFSFNSMFFIIMLSCFILAAILHPQEWSCILPFFLYLLLIPSMYCLLPIYALTNMNNINWGTREDKPKNEGQSEKKIDSNSERSRDWKLYGGFDWKKNKFTSGLMSCICCSGFKSSEYQENENSMINRNERLNERISAIIEDERRINNLRKYESAPQLHCHDTIPEIVIENMIENCSVQNNEMKKEETDIKRLNDNLFESFKLTKLDDDELKFWKDFIQKYLTPPGESEIAKQKDQMETELKELRNRMVFHCGMINAIIVFMIFLLQINQQVIYIEIGKIKMGPISLCILVFFGTIFLIQLYAMLRHRIGTIAQLLASTNLDFFSKTDYVTTTNQTQGNSEEENEGQRIYNMSSSSRNENQS